MTEAPHQEEPQRADRRTIAIIAVVVAAMLLIAVIYTLQSLNSQEGSVAPTASSPSGEASPPVPEASASAAAEEAVDAVIAPELEPVAPDVVAKGEDGVQFDITQVESVQGTGFLPGETNAPVIRVTLEIENNSEEVVDLVQVVVNAYYGEDRVPADQLSEPGGVNVGGSLEIGSKTKGVYLFAVPEDQRDNVVLGIDYRAGLKTVTFSGKIDG